MVKETSAERNARRMLPALRLIQVYVPLKAARWAEARGTAAVRPRDGITHTAISAGGVRCVEFTNRGDRAFQRVLGKAPAGEKQIDGPSKRDIPAGNGGGPRATVGRHHVAVLSYRKTT